MRNLLMLRRLPGSRGRRIEVVALALVMLAFSALAFGAAGLATAGLIIPAVWAAERLVSRSSLVARGRRDPATGLLERAGVVAALDGALLRASVAPVTTAAIVLEVVDFKQVEERLDRAGVERCLSVIGARLASVVRETDSVGRLDGPVFAVALSSVRRLDLAAAIQLCTRLQQAVAQPVPIGEVNLHLTASVGFCLAARLQDPTGERLLQAATSAMIEAGRGGGGAIRGYSSAMRSRILSRNSLSSEVARALDKGELQAFFQPQVATFDRQITGIEALARWIHPERGLIPPVEFLPALEQAGLMDRLGGEMVHQSLAALRRWDAMGLVVPRVAVNFSTEELRDPGLADRIAQDLDRFGLDPSRLTIEVLETVVASRSEAGVIDTLARLSALGCTLDLDDFGTGHASITNIRRFSIARIKIDRSFVTRIDTDADQQMMFAAILTMADRLKLDTLAEGVETEGELAMLADLGCRHAQGFAIARPMPLDEMTDWLDCAGAREEGELGRMTG